MYAVLVGIACAFIGPVVAVTWYRIGVRVGAERAMMRGAEAIVDLTLNAAHDKIMKTVDEVYGPDSRYGAGLVLAASMIKPSSKER